MRSSLSLAFLLCAPFGFAQITTNISCTSAEALAAMKGLHDPENYAASDVIDDHAEILCALRTRISPDSLREHLVAITDFGTRQQKLRTAGTSGAERSCHQNPTTSLHYTLSTFMSTCPR